MSPVDFGPSDVKNPTNVAYVQVPESYFQHRCLVFQYEGLFTDPSDPTKVSPAEGLVPFLQLAHRLSLRLGLYSAQEDSAVMETLSSLEVASCFDSIRCHGDVEALPPAPDLYQITLDTLGVKADRVVEFEALESGVDYAHAFGVFTVGVDRGRGAPRGSDYQVKAFTEKSLLDLLNDIDMAQRKRRL